MNADIPWLRLLAEMVVIVFSVLLALVMDDWRDDRADDALVATVSTSLLTELHWNQTTLEARLPYHRAMLDTFNARGERIAAGEGDLRRLAGRFQVPLLHEMGFANGLGTSPDFAHSAWDVAVSSGAVNHMDVSLAFTLSTAYTKQAELAATQDRLLDKLELYELAALEGERPLFATISFMATLTDLVLREEEQCEWYLRVGRQLGGDDPEGMGECGSGRVSMR